MDSFAGRGAIASLFPDFVAAYDANPLVIDAVPHPEEALFVASAVPQRRMEFLAGRACARLALARLGIDTGPVLMAEDRSPIWPPGVVGSISHAEGYCGAAVARTSHARGLGFDVECVRVFSQDMTEQICVPQERAQLRALPSAKRQQAATLIFSAKEAVYKCVHPLAKRWLDLHDVAIVANPEAGVFDAAFLVDYERFAKGSLLKGRFAFHGEYVFTAIVLEA